MINSNQDRFEAEQQQLGFERRQRMTQRLLRSGHASHNNAELRLMSASIGLVADQIAKRITEWEAVSANHRSPVYHLLQRLKPEQMAFIAQQQVLNCLHMELKLQVVARRVGAAIRCEWQAQELRRQRPWAWKFWVATGRIGVSSSATQVRRALDHVDLELPKFDTLDCVRLGIELVEIIRRVGGWCDISVVETMTRGKRKTVKKVLPTRARDGKPGAVEWLMAQNERDWASHPVHMPMVEQPRDWTSLTDGGYRHLQMDLVTGVSAGWIDAQATRDLSEVLSAVNAMQRTPWRINEDVLVVMEEAFFKNWEIGGVPAFNEEEIAPRPEPYLEDQPEAKEWRMNAAKTHERNRRNRSKRFQIAESIRIARLMRDEPCIFFVLQLDFRGRVYTRCTSLSPQASDAQRSLLTFAEAKPLKTREAWDWLCIHGANVAGKDKLPFAERVQFVIDNEHIIKSVAADPIADRRWADGWDDCETVDKPWAFLAFCLDYTNALVSGSSSIPVAQDAVCSGLQIYSAMLLDQRGGEGTALVPAQRPSDIYSDVAATLTERVAEHAETNSLAREWLQSTLICRQITKRPTMTLSYGVTAQGIYEQTKEIMEEWRVAAARDGREIPFSNYLKATGFIVEHLKDVLAETVTSAFSAMQALRAAAKILARRGVHAQWITPTNWQVTQHYTVRRSRRVRTILHGTITRLWVTDESGAKPDSRRSIQGIAPNVIHSLDAACLVKTVNAVCRTQSNAAFSMIHDSFAVNAADAPLLAKTVREEFVAMFTPDVLNDILDQLKEQVGPAPITTWPDRLPRGDLNLEEVLESPYFFS